MNLDASSLYEVSAARHQTAALQNGRPGRGDFLSVVNFSYSTGRLMSTVKVGPSDGEYVSR